MVYVANQTFFLKNRIITFKYFSFLYLFVISMTRFWSVELDKLCDQHLLGLHKEIHQEIGSLRNGRIETVLGHIRKGQVNFENVLEYHEDVEDELRSRGFNPDSPIDSELHGFLEALSDWGYTCEDFDRVDLMIRCSDCRNKLEP